MCSGLSPFPMQIELLLLNTSQSTQIAQLRTIAFEDKQSDDPSFVSKPCRLFEVIVCAFSNKFNSLQ